MQDLEPLFVQSISVILAALVPLIATWLRTRTRRMVVEQAATEVEARGFRESLSGGQKKSLAVDLAASRLGSWTSLTDEEIGDLVEASLPLVRVSAPPPRS